MAKPKRPSLRGMDAFLTDEEAPPVQRHTSETAQQDTGIPVEQYPVKTGSQDTSKPVFMKGTYYITLEHDFKLERVRLARKHQGIKVDKSALIREAIDLLQESEAPRPVITQPAPLEQKTPAPGEVEADTPDTAPHDDLVSLQSFADLHAVNRNEATRLWSSGQIAGNKQGSGRQRTIMLAVKGRRDFWVQFHETQGFRACDDCPHGP